MEIYTKLKKIRQGKDLKIREIAKKTGLSTGFISQVERGITQPSMESLKKITSALEITMGDLFQNYRNPLFTNSVSSTENIKIIRADQRRRLILPNSEITYHLLSPDLNRKIEFILLEIEKGGESGEENYVHEGEECGIVLKGKLELIINNKTYILEEGDSICFPSNLRHGWKNVGNEKIWAVWAITPPSL